MSIKDFLDDMRDLSSAEDFLEYFEIEFDEKVVHVNRLHILQRFHDYLAKAADRPGDEMLLREHYKSLLLQAYRDFVSSDALTEKVFKVFHMHGPQETFVSLNALVK
ncbi:MAG: nitrogenase-stabilizing/protective protein NifW [Pseudomonadota bacterium]